MVEKRTGRPMKPAEPGKRVSLGIKVTADLKSQIDGAAKAKGNTQSQEAEYRLNRSFAEEGLFASRAVKMWAILLAENFHREGISAASHLGVDADGDAWMNNPGCLVPATFATIDHLLHELERQPGADIGLIDMWMKQLMARFQHRTGQLKFFDKDGNEMKSGFFEPKGDDDGTR